MNLGAFIESTYLVSGLALPLFYVPQVIKLARDQTLLEAYSLSKATAQLVLRLPALAFALVIVDHWFMTVVLAADVLGRVAECGVAVHSLRRQGASWASTAWRLMPWHAWRGDPHGSVAAVDQASATEVHAEPAAVELGLEATPVVEKVG